MSKKFSQDTTSFRKLAAIMFTDIVGYTALMDNDEELAFALLQRNRSIHKPLIEIFHGKFLKEMGDGILASFASVSDAVYCAGAIQKACENEPDLNLRIGIHQGEVVSHGDDVFGSGVNIASRIEAIAPAGKIWVSDSVQRNLQNKKGIIIEFVKEETLKNVKQPVGIYDIKVDENYTVISNSAYPSNISDHSESNEKSIAVLPFVNMSNDPEQDYFCDGLSEELLNVLAQLDKIKVAARTSSFMFKGNHNITEIGRKLNVSTILEGSVRKSQNRLRITAQLINVEDGYHLWSERYDQEIEDIFDIQDKIALAILKELKVKLLGDKIDQVLKRETENTEAYQYYLKGRFNFHDFSREGYLTAIKYYDKALELVPNYAKAHAGKASCYLNLWHFVMLPPEDSFYQMKDSTYKAMELNDQIAESHYAMARFKLWHDFDLKGAEKEFINTFKFNPNIPEAISHYGFVQNFLGHHKKAISYVRKAKDLDPFSPMTNLDLIANLWVASEYDSMLQVARKILEIHPQFWAAYLYIVYYHWIHNENDKVLDNFKKMMEIYYGQVPISMMGCFYGISGNEKKAREILLELEKMAADTHIASFHFALVYCGIGEMDKTFEYLEKAGKERTGLLIFLDYLARDLIPHIKKDSRFIPYLKKTGIPLCKI